MKPGNGNQYMGSKLSLPGIYLHYTGQIYDADVRISGEFIRSFYREYEDALRADGLYMKLEEHLHLLLL